MVRSILMLSETTMLVIFMPGFNRLRGFNAKTRTYLEFTRAKRRVPAYKEFLKRNNFKKPSFSGLIPNVDEIPFTDKENYVRQFSMDERCVGGQMPTKYVIIDESSGSSGTATNWARGKIERKRNAKFIKFGVRALLGKEPMFIINAFALGPWATGVNITMSCVPFSKLKSLGPEKEKIENTLKHFGKEHRYVIMGYPPFLKMLIDNSDINWKEYNITLIFGGESMSEGMRDYLIKRGVRQVFSSLGASDLELNISAENPFTISVRRLLRSNQQLREELLQHPGALPMIFQYNPSDFLFESSEEGELIVTVCRPDYISPKIRYNIHDRGHVVQLKELLAIFKKLGIKEDQYEKPLTDLPLLFHYGRADMTVMLFGANISPNDVQETLYNLPDLAEVVNSFALSTPEDEDGNKKLVVALELAEGKNTDHFNLAELQESFFKELANVNVDFRSASSIVTNNVLYELQFFGLSEGAFADNDIRIKLKYIQ
jgi:phenylacetate-CoA ligase